MKSAIQLHINGIKSAFSALSEGKFLLFFIPGALIGLIFWLISIFTETVASSFSFLESIPIIGSYLLSGVKGTFGIVNFIMDQLFIFFILTLLSPFNAILSEKMDSSITGKTYPFDFFDVISSIIRMICIVFIAVLLELIVLGMYWIISRMLGFHFLDQVAFFCIAAFFYGFSFYDYSLERDQLSVLKSLKFTIFNFPIILLTGSIFLAIYYIPVIGVIISPVITVLISTYIYLQINVPTLNSTTA